MQAASKQITARQMRYAAGGGLEIGSDRGCSMYGDALERIRVRVRIQRSSSSSSSDSGSSPLINKNAHTWSRVN